MVKYYYDKYSTVTKDVIALAQGYSGSVSPAITSLKIWSEGKLGYTLSVYWWRSATIDFSGSDKVINLKNNDSVPGDDFDRNYTAEQIYTRLGGPVGGGSISIYLEDYDTSKKKNRLQITKSPTDEWSVYLSPLYINQEYTKGSLVQSNIPAEDGIYPANGRHTDGYWYVKGTIVNTAPSTPGAFTKPTATTLLVGTQEITSWGASTDAEGNLSKYVLESSINGGNFTQIGTPSNPSFPYTIPIATSIQFRVKAQDSGGLESNYRTSNIYTVIKPNQTPTVSLTSPSENITLYENDTLNISGAAYDGDTDQSVTVYYQINSEQRKVLATNLSQTQITLSKQLKFKAGKLYDGDTAISGSLVDGVAHKLKVWAVDSENASSSIVERTFYVVPNRAPLLTVNPPMPSGIIDADSFVINGTFEDPDKNETTVSYRINGANSVQIATGTSGTFDFNVSLGALIVGENVITVEAVDSYGAKTTQTVKLRKNKVAVPINKSTARYKILPPTGSASEILVWIQRDAKLTLKASASMTLSGEQEAFKSMELTNTADLQNGQVEDEFYLAAGEAKDSIVLQLELEKSDASASNAITLIMGVL